jgi:serine-type D-Ala-D-Ala carboxypeptidase/endopeptidase (penicillin-binding protein 4)
MRSAWLVVYTSIVFTFERTAGLKACATAVTLLLTACHPHVPPGPASPASPAPPASPALQKDIDAILGDPALARGYWGVLVKSLKTDETLYSLNARRLMMPASNMKIVTLAAAAEQLGWDYTYETSLRIAGSIDNGALNGDLVVIGSGDPSLAAGADGADRLFATWAERLKTAGIRAINGRVIGDDHAFEGETLGFGWSWDDLPDDYAAGVGALQLNEDAVRVTIAPGPAVGDLAGVTVAPIPSGLEIDSMVATAAADSQPMIRTHRLPGSAHLEVRGSIPLGHTPVVAAVAVDNPTQFFANALRAALIANGIDVRGPAVDIDALCKLSIDNCQFPGPVLVTHKSPPLSTLAMRLMKASQNQYAETLLKTLGRGTGTATATAGRAAVQTILQSWGIAMADLIQRDGSGLSRYDYVTPEALVTILTHVDRDARLREPFEASLPIAGRDGSLANRMKGTPAEANVRAKTGSMSNVRSLSGYATSADGEPLVFSIIANNFDAPPETINQTTDAIVVRLATWRRP